MKNEALIRGAELEPTSWTLGMSSGRGVVSMRRCWLNLGSMLDVLVGFKREYSPGLSPRHFAAIERGGAGLGVVRVVGASGVWTVVGVFSEGLLDSGTRQQRMW
jgi:hypothetical protein